MREELHTHLAEAGWKQIPGTDAFLGPNGERAGYVADGEGLPGDVLTLTPPDRAIGLAIGLEAGNLAEVSRFAAYLHQAITEGAGLPWLDRLRHLGPVWIRPGDQDPWLETVAGAKNSVGPVAETLKALATDPSDAAVARAERMAATLAAAGWRDTTTRSTKTDHGQRMLRAAAKRTPAGMQRLSYVLTGNPDMPEALRWRAEVPRVYSGSLRHGVLIDTSGAADLRLPIGDDADGDRLAEVLTLLLRDIPAITTYQQWSNTAFAISTITSVRFSGPSSARMGFVQPELTPTDGPSLVEALRFIDVDPDSEAWLWTGSAAEAAGDHQLAVAAFTQAAQRHIGGGLPLLRRGWLTRYADPEAAVADLEKAAWLGGVAGEALTRQARVYWDVLGDPEAAVKAGALAIIRDPDYVPGWEWHGLFLAKHGQAARAVEVLTDAVRRRETPTLWHYLGYAHLILGRKAKALTCLENAVRLGPDLAFDIYHDPDLAELQFEPRFNALSDLVAREAAAAEHDSPRRTTEDEPDRKYRESLRPRALPAIPDNLLDRLRAAYAIREVGTKGFEVTTLPPPLGELQLRELLCSKGLGLPHQIGDFTGTRQNWMLQYLPTEEYPLPLGLGDGMFHLGALGDDLQVAVDGSTGEVFTVDSRFTLSYVSPSLGAFLLDKCLAEGEHTWCITANTVDQLDSVDGIAAGRLGILAEDLDEPTRGRLAEFIITHGSLLGTLLVREGKHDGAGLDILDFATVCPNLRRLDLHGSRFDESVFTHPVLEKLRLHQSEYCGGLRDIRLDSGSRLEILNLEDTIVDADSLYAGPNSPLQVFTASLDQDFGSEFPARLEFDGPAHLWGIQVHCGLAHWHLELRGRLPALIAIDQDGLQHGGFTFSVADASDADRDRYLSLIRAGADFIQKMR